jgi:diacylglycerol O-acyltransferase
VLFSPLNVTHPCWEDDPAFDIRNHITRVKLDPPGSEQQLSELSGRVFTALMDRSKPLWDLTVVDGLEHDRSALIVRVHHSLVDGVSGVALVNIMFDPTREPQRVEPKPYKAPPLPDAEHVLVEGLASTWADAAARLIGAQITVLRLVQAFTGESSKTTLNSLLATMPELLRPTQKLPFNAPCSGVRGHCWTTFPFAEARAIRSALGGTINDVVLTTVVGAVSRYVTAHRESVKDRFVRLMVPVNLRSGETGGGVGNEISMLPLSLPLYIADPAERMRAVTARSFAMKSARIADVIALIGTWIGWTPPAMQQSLAAMPFLPQPVLMFNMVCTNVPGPMVPLYSNGRELLTYYPHVPCGSEVGISVAISSYNKSLYYGVTYDAQAAPDGELFRDFLIESYEELRGAAGVAATPVSRPGRQEPVRVSQTDLRAHLAPEEPSVPETAIVEPEQKPVGIGAADLPPGPSPQQVPVTEPVLAEPVVAALPDDGTAHLEAEQAAEVAPGADSQREDVPVEVSAQPEPAALLEPEQVVQVTPVMEAQPEKSEAEARLEPEGAVPPVSAPAEAGQPEGAPVVRRPTLEAARPKPGAKVRAKQRKKGKTAKEVGVGAV